MRRFYHRYTFHQIYLLHAQYKDITVLFHQVLLKGL